MGFFRVTYLWAEFLKSCHPAVCLRRFQGAARHRADFFGPMMALTRGGSGGGGGGAGGRRVEGLDSYCSSPKRTMVVPLCVSL